ncbi:MAG: permease [Spirochaetes bacterium]|nr:permease [Spirochaetota bacterium]
MLEILVREINFFVFSFQAMLSQIFFYWIFGMVLGSLISVFGKKKLNALFRSLQEKHLGLLGIIPASIIGIASPLCMFGTIPITASFAKNGMGEDWLAAFMMSSIILNPQLIFFSVALGNAALTIRIVGGFLCGITAGLLVHIFYKDRGKKFFNFKSFGDVEDRDTDPSLVLRFLKNLFRNIKVTAPAFVIGITIAALFERYVPPDFVAGFFGRHRGFGLLMATSMGVPLHLCGAASIPLLISWMHSGMSLGSATAFMLAGPAMKITNLGALKIVMGGKAFAIYIAYAFLFAFFMGFLVDFSI